MVRAREGEVALGCICGGEARPKDVGLPTDFLLGLTASARLVLSCLAVIPTYFDAREPGVIMDSGALFLAGVRLFLVRVVVLVLAEGTTVAGVFLLEYTTGVIRPAGVTRPVVTE